MCRHNHFQGIIMLVREAAIVAIDFETTGVVPGFPEEPWQIGLAFVQAGCLAPDYRFASPLRVESGRPFNAYVPGRHASLRDELAAAPSLPELWPQLIPWLQGRPLLAHNAAVEKKMLAQAFPLHSFGPWIDTLVLARQAFPKARSHKLEDLLETLHLTARVEAICPGMQPHDALYDAAGAAILLEYLLSLPRWHDLALGHLL
jgi:DNA polymerase-3 subunit epsilon